MHIHIHVDSVFHTLTTGTPYRGMLAELCARRPDDSFVLSILKNTKSTPMFTSWLEANQLPNIEIVELPLSRRTVNFSTFLGYPCEIPVEKGADLYITADQEILTDHDVPRVIQVYDLSSINAPARSSLKWMSRRVRRVQAAAHASLNTTVVAISEFTKQDLIQFDRRFENRVRSMHIGIEDDWFRTPRLTANEVRSRFSLPDEYYCWWGFASPRKNIDGVIRAYGLAKKHEISLPKFLIIGNVPNSPIKLLELMESQGVRDQFQIMDHQDLSILRDIVAASTGVVFPSFYEGFGLPVVEGLAAGAQVLASDIPALREVAQEHALYCNPSSPESILRGLNAMAQERPGKEGFRWARQFTHEANARRYGQMIDELT